MYVYIYISNIYIHIYLYARYHVHIHTYVVHMKVYTYTHQISSTISALQKLASERRTVACSHQAHLPPGAQQEKHVGERPSAKRSNYRKTMGKPYEKHGKPQKKNIGNMMTSPSNMVILAGIYI